MRGLAYMAMQLAGFRAWGGVISIHRDATPIPRKELECWAHCESPAPFSTEYYKIIDRITRGEQP